MLSGIASFLFGRETSSQTSGGGCLEYDTREEDEWIVVDITDTTKVMEKKQVEKRSCKSKSPSTEFLPVSKDNPSPSHSGTSMSPPRPSSVSPSQMEGSWYVTPPPCFTAGGPVHVEISPLENLLIEHPSMSVYGSTPLSSLHCNSQQTEPPTSPCISLSPKKEHVNELTSSSSPAPLSPSPVSPQASQLPSLPQPTSEQRKHRVRNAQVMTNRTSHRPVDISGRAGLLEQIENLAPVQRAQKRQEQRKLRSSQMDRQNRVRLYQSSSRNLRRKDRWLRHSGVNNNRKC